MVERDTVTSRAAVNGARNSAIRFTAFDFNDNRRAVPDDNGAARWCIEYPPAQGGGMSIAQRDILGEGRFSCTDGSGSPGFIAAVGGGVVGGKGEGSRVFDAFEGEAAVGRIDGHFILGIGGGPYLGGFDDGALRGIRGAGGGGYRAGYGCGVCVGDCFGLRGRISRGGNGDGAYGGIEESGFLHGEGEGGGGWGDLGDGEGAGFPAHGADGGGSLIRGDEGAGGAAAEFQGAAAGFTQLQGEADGSSGAVGISRGDSATGRFRGVSSGFTSASAGGRTAG